MDWTLAAYVKLFVPILRSKQFFYCKSTKSLLKYLKLSINLTITKNLILAKTNIRLTVSTSVFFFKLHVKNFNISWSSEKKNFSTEQIASDKTHIQNVTKFQYRPAKPPVAPEIPKNKSFGKSMFFTAVQNSYSAVGVFPESIYICGEKKGKCTFYNRDDVSKKASKYTSV